MNQKNKLKSPALLRSTFTLPALTYMIVFIEYLMVQDIILSFKEVSVHTFANPDAQKFVGFQSYVDLFTDKNSILLRSIRSTLIFTVGSIFFQLIIGFGMALLFQKKFPGCSFFRGVTMISWLLPVTVAGLLFKFVFTLSGGIINRFLMVLHVLDQPTEWLLHLTTAMFAIIVVNIWIGIPFNMMPLLTGLTTVPNDVYESASLDGAGKPRALISITILMIKPAIMSVLTPGLAYTFKVFDLVWVITKGGPVNSMELVFTYAYRLSSEEFIFGRGASATNILFLILLVVGFFYIRLIGEDEVMWREIF